jgi:hypothetical protein
MIECFKHGLIWRGLVHDMSKFLPSEWIPYAHYFCDGRKNKTELDRAWILHQKRNRHHPEWWVYVNEDGTHCALPMEEPYLTEMICDLICAGKAKGFCSPKNDPFFETREFWKKNSHAMILHPDTRAEIEKRLSV